LLIFGLSNRYAWKTNAGIPQQWGRFAPHIGHIENQVGFVVYGVCRNAEEAGSYDYICGVEVTAFPAHPEEFVQVSLPARTYAVVDHIGHIATIADTWNAVWEQGPPAGYQADDAPSFERYDERFDPRTGLGGLEIWIPVRPS
jgi:AraC family transcriptional regulator